MKTYYDVVFVCELGQSVHQKRFETLTSLYQFFHGYLKCRDYVLYSRVFVTRYWLLKGRFYSAGFVSFYFDDVSKDYCNNRWIRNKLRFYFDADWVFDSSFNCFVTLTDKVRSATLQDFRRIKSKSCVNL